jgi:hypothetical protein
MSKFCSLTLIGEDYGLPVVGDLFAAPRHDVHSGDITYPKQIFDRWTAVKLNSIGYAPVVESAIPAGYHATGSSDVLDAGTVTRTYTTEADPPIPSPTVLTFDAFEGRFTGAEWDDATDFVYEVNTTTGKPKRRALVQGLARAQARNRVDLEDNKTDVFLGVLVSGGVLTAERKIEILTP